MGNSLIVILIIFRKYLNASALECICAMNFQKKIGLSLKIPRLYTYKEYYFGYLIFIRLFIFANSGQLNIFAGHQFRKSPDNIYFIIMLLNSTKFVCFLYLFAGVFAVTSLTTGNCPDEYDFTAANITSDGSAQSLVSFIYGGMFSKEDQAKLQKSYSSGDTKTVSKYSKAINLIVPFALLGSGFAIAFFVALCCCVCQKSCPPCKNWKRDFSNRPYEKSELKCLTFFSILFAASIALTTIVGFIFFPDMKKNIQMTRCSLYYSLDIAINGDPNSGWGGFLQISSQVGNISSQLVTASTAVNAQLSGSDWLITDMETMRQENANLYKNNQDSTVYSPNPTETASAISSNSPLPTVTPLFISDGLGPYTKNQTMTYYINEGLKVTETLSLQGHKVFKAAQLLANSANNIQTNNNINLRSFAMNENYFNDISLSITNFSADIFDSIFNWGLYLIQALLAFVVIASLLVLLGIISIHFCEIYTCKTCVHLGWVTYGFTYFGILIIGFFFFSLGGLSYSFCQFYGGLIKNPNTYTSFSDAEQPTSFNKIFGKLDTCFFSNGSITNSFMINREVKTISDLYSQINLYNDMRNISNTKYVDLTQSTGIINGWISAVEKYRLGIYIDASSSLTTEQNPYNSIKQMNKYSNGQTAVVPTCTNDYWVFDVTNCSSTGFHYYSVSATSGTTFAANGSTCIPFNQKFSSGNTWSWNASQISKRYLQRRQCNGNTQAYDYITSYATALVNYRDSRINLYQNIKDQLSSLLTKNNAFNTKINTYTTKVRDFALATSTLATLVTNDINGLEKSTNCTAVANSLRLLYNVFCVNFIRKSVQFGICCVILLAIMIGGMLTGSVFGMRYGRIEKQKKLVMPQSPVISSIHSETFEKRHDSSDSSSSEDQ